MTSPGMTTLSVLDGLSILRQTLAGSNGVALSPAVTLTDQFGNPFQAGNPIQVQDAAAEAAVSNIAVSSQATAVGIGTPADITWTGTGNGSAIAILKAIELAIVAGVPITSGAVQVLGSDGIHKAAVNSSNQLTVTDTAAEASLATIATNTTGTQGAGSQYNPPTGGSGLLGYLSAIAAYLASTLTVGLAAGTNTVGTVLLGASSSVIGVLGAGSNQIGSVVLAAGSALVGKVTALPPTAAYVTTNPSVTTTSAVLAANAATSFMMIQNASGTVGVTLLNGAATLCYLPPRGVFNPAIPPTNAITATADTGSVTLNVSVA